MSYERRRTARRRAGVKARPGSGAALVALFPGRVLAKVTP